MEETGDAIQAFRLAYQKHGGDPEKVCAELGITKGRFWFYEQKAGLTSKPKRVRRQGRIAATFTDEAVTPDNARAILQSLLGNVSVPEDELCRLIDEHIQKRHYQGYHFVDEKAQEVREVDGIFPSWFFKALTPLKLGRPVLLVGPAGCGKSTVARLIAKALGLRFGFLSMSGGVSESAVTGRYIPAKGGEFEFLASTISDFFENGGLFFVDEIDAGDPNTLISLNAMLDDLGELALPDRRKNPIAKRHQDFRLVASSNTFGHGATREYQGRNPLDMATMNRFQVVECDYDPGVEEKIVDQEVLAWGRKVRESIEKHKFKRFVTTRDLVWLTRYKINGVGQKDLEESVFVNWTEDEVKKTRKYLETGEVAKEEGDE